MLASEIMFPARKPVSPNADDRGTESTANDRARMPAAILKIFFLLTIGTVLLCKLRVLLMFLLRLKYIVGDLSSYFTKS